MPRKVESHYDYQLCVTFNKLAGAQAVALCASITIM